MPAKNGSANTASVKSSQQRNPMAAMLTRMLTMIMVVAP